MFRHVTHTDPCRNTRVINKYESCVLYNISSSSNRKWGREANSIPAFATTTVPAFKSHPCPPPSYWAVGPATEQDWGKLEKITATWYRSVEKGRTLAWTRIGFGSLLPHEAGKLWTSPGRSSKGSGEVRTSRCFYRTKSQMPHRLGVLPHIQSRLLGTGEVWSCSTSDIGGSHVSPKCSSEYGV